VKKLELKPFFKVSKVDIGGSTTKKKPKKKKPTKVWDCEQCLLYTQVNSSKMEPYGRFLLEALVWGEAPGATEDKLGRQFVGNAGKFLRSKLDRHGIDLDRDCKCINSLDCRPTYDNTSNRPPSKKELRCCHIRKREFLERAKPKVILLLGDFAYQSFYELDPDRNFMKHVKMAGLRGLVIPDRKENAWICHSYHPSYIQRGNEDKEHIFDLDISVFASMLNKPRPKSSIDIYTNIKVLDDFEELMYLLTETLLQSDSVAFDYETSSYRYYERIHSIHMISLSIDSRRAFVFPLDYKLPNKKHFWNSKQFSQITTAWKEFLESDIPKIAQNIKHEELASRYCFGTYVNNWHWDTMLANHCLNGTKYTSGLKTQVYIKYGIPDYSVGVKKFLEADPKKRNKFEEIPFKDAVRYSGADSKSTFLRYKDQERLIRKNGLVNGYELFHKASLAFADMEQNGIAVDEKLMKEFDIKWGEEIEEKKELIFTSKFAKRFEKIKGRPLKFNKQFSQADLRVLYFDLMKLKASKETKTGKSVDVESMLPYMDNEIVEAEVRIRKLIKLKGTYLKNFFNYSIDGILYPSYLLHTTRSMRSSSAEPNFQNIVKRDKTMSEIRKCLITRFGKNGSLLSVDYGSMEVRIIAAVSGCQALIDMVKKGFDFHGDWACKIFGITREDKNFKGGLNLRFHAKNRFVFRLFYGGHGFSAAKDLLEFMPDDFESGKPQAVRVKRWEKHFDLLEAEFWKTFSGVKEWQKKLVKGYTVNCYVDSAWGFKRTGYLNTEKIINYPIQGPAFHCLLWSIVKLKERDYYNWKSLLCGQIHDQLLYDALNKEEEDIIKKTTKIMTVDIRKDQKWITVPLSVEWKKGKNMYEMEDI